MAPLEALEIAIRAAGISSMQYDRPGYIISKLSKEVREALQEITSDDVRKLRHAFVGRYARG